MGGCDKTTPGAADGRDQHEPAGDLHAGGPDALAATGATTTLGSGSDTWKYWAELRAGNITQKDWQEIEDGIARSPGTCMTMGTAATMMSLAESARLHAARRRVDPGARLQPRARWRRSPASASSTWCGRTSSRATS